MSFEPTERSFRAAHRPPRYRGPMVDAAQRRSVAAPAYAAGSAVAIGLVLAVRDPRTSTYVPCPLHAVTGLWCPGCGATRAFGDLVRGDVASAMSSNALAVVLLAIAVALWIRWVVVRARGLGFGKPPMWVVLSGVVLVSAFTVLRNLPAGAWLAP